MGLTLSDLRDGESGRVLALRMEGPLYRRLTQLGITPGTRVTMVSRAPLNDPMEIFLRGYRLALRKSEGRRILLSS